MATIFDGNSQYGSISDGTVDGNNAKNKLVWKVVLL